MKKKILSMVMIMILLTLSLAGCKSKKTDGEGVAEETQRANVIEKDADTGEEYYLLADFENYFECAQIKNTKLLGKVTEIKKQDEPDKVTYGEQSAKIEIVGTSTTWGIRKPSMRIGTDSGFFNKTRDFSNMSRFTFDIYNAQDYEANIRFFVSTDISKGATLDPIVYTNLNYEYNIVLDIDLEPNSWNHIEIPAEDIRIVKNDENNRPYFVYGAEALEIVGAFVIQFDRGELHEEQEVFYVDNVRAYLKSE